MQLIFIGISRRLEMMDLWPVLMLVLQYVRTKLYSGLICRFRGPVYRDTIFNLGIHEDPCCSSCLAG